MNLLDSREATAHHATGHLQTIINFTFTLFQMLYGLTALKITHNSGRSQLVTTKPPLFPVQYFVLKFFDMVWEYRTFLQSSVSVKILFPPIVAGMPHSTSLTRVCFDGFHLISFDRCHV
jgi:hypothetical protein